MTWRTFSYCSLCFAAALVVASTAGSGAATEAQAATQSVLAVQSLPVPAVPEPARMAALILGLVATVLTFQKAWENMRHRP